MTYVLYMSLNKLRNYIFGHKLYQWTHISKWSTKVTLFNGMGVLFGKCTTKKETKYLVQFCLHQKWLHGCCHYPKLE